MPLSVKVSGSWRNAIPKVKVSGSWRDVKQMYVKVSGVWREILQRNFISDNVLVFNNTTTIPFFLANPSTGTNIKNFNPDDYPETTGFGTFAYKKNMIYDPVNNVLYSFFSNDSNSSIKRIVKIGNVDDPGPFTILGYYEFSPNNPYYSLSYDGTNVYLISIYDSGSDNRYDYFVDKFDSDLNFISTNSLENVVTTQTSKPLINPLLGHEDTVDSLGFVATYRGNSGANSEVNAFNYLANSMWSDIINENSTIGVIGGSDTNPSEYLYVIAKRSTTGTTIHRYDRDNGLNKLTESLPAGPSYNAPSIISTDTGNYVYVYGSNSNEIRIYDLNLNLVSTHTVSTITTGTVNGIKTIQKYDEDKIAISCEVADGSLFGDSAWMIFTPDFSQKFSDIDGPENEVLGQSFMTLTTNNTVDYGF